jgi:hypothetical protein
MKRLAVAHIVLGILIIGSLVFWYLAILDGYLDFDGTVPQGDVGVTVFMMPGYVGSLEIWRFGHLFLGLLVTVFGIARYITARRQEKTGQESGNWLAVTHIALGGLIIASLIWFIGWVEFDYNNPVVIQEGLEITLHYVSGWYARLILWKAIAFTLGLAIAGCGVFELIKAGGTAK